MSSDRTVTVNLSPPMFLLFLTFLVLKLTEVIDWSWGWVTAPLWGPIALIFGAFLIFFTVFLICYGLGIKWAKKIVASQGAG